MVKGLLACILFAVLGLVSTAYVLSVEAHREGPIHEQGVQGWSTNGPYGGRLFNVAVDALSPTVAYVAGPQTGVFGTLNGGENWSLLLPDPEGVSCQDAALVTHPDLPGTVFYAAHEDLYRSDDYGATWSPLRDNGKPIAEGHVIELDPSNPNRIFVGLCGGGRVLRSSDRGATWDHLVILGMPADAAVGRLALDPVVTSTIYAGSGDGGGIYRSLDGGDNWEPTPGQPVISDTQGMAVSPHDRTVYHGGGFGPLSYSQDQGHNWYTLTVGTAPASHAWRMIKFHPVQTQTLYVGDVGHIWRSTDAGLSWESIVGGVGWDLAIHPVQTDTMYAVASGVKVSTDGGENWAARNQGITAIRPIALAIAPGEPSRLLVGTGEDQGFYTLDGGESWNETDARLYNAVAFDPLSPTVAYGSGMGGGVCKSEDGGVTWSGESQLPLDGFDGVEVRSLAVHPLTHTSVYAGVGFNSNSVPCLQEGGVYRSDDAGGSWERIEVGIPISRVTTIVIAPTAPYSMYIATGCLEDSPERGNGIFRSTDGGQSWSAINDGLPDLNVHTIEMNPNNPAELLSAPRDQEWYFGGLGVYRSTDGGETWHPANTGLDEQPVRDLEYDPVKPGVVYAATWGGLFWSENDGDVWNRWPDDMGRVPVESVAAAEWDQNNTTVYVGAIGGIVTRTQELGPSAIEQDIVQAGVYARAMRWWYPLFVPLALKQY